MEHFYKNIHGWFDFEDVYSEMVSTAQSGSHFVEIGSWKGKSTAYMAVEIVNSRKLIKFDCIDTWLGSFEHTQGQWAEDSDVVNGNLFDTFLQNIQPVRGVINPIRMSSVAASALYIDNSLDFVFLDGAHDPDSVNADIISWYPKVKNGGILGGHDFGWISVSNVVRSHFNDFKVINDSWLKLKN